MKISQKERVVKYIKELGITQLGARIDQLKKEGYHFKTEWEHKKNRFQEPTTYKRYFLVEE